MTWLKPTSTKKEKREKGHTTVKESSHRYHEKETTLEGEPPVIVSGEASTGHRVMPMLVPSAAAEEDDDNVDLFGEETEEEKKAAEERPASIKSSTKKKESGKSSVLMDVKPWDDETDMKKLEEAVRSVQMEGLLWGAFKQGPPLPTDLGKNVNIFASEADTPGSSTDVAPSSSDTSMNHMFKIGRA
ncbi:hypothetical protein Q3G72_031648 [Acer saccharum]|nr:hypothetical protein Q3G72_031648 [Acer saccharum]